MKKLIMCTGAVFAMLLANCAMAGDADSSDLRNPVGGKITQMMNPAAGAVSWQIVQADSAACQKFLGLFNDQPEVLKYSVDCWLDSDNESAKLPVKVVLKVAGKDLVLETRAPTLKTDDCATAVGLLKTFKDVTVVGQCPAQPVPAPAPEAASAPAAK